ncbi:hypothetical protein J6590_002489 [Homalodisca vitripennis]|nr:hypothetical protein J6590_002489 [Homalodisca vitripennis]
MEASIVCSYCSESYSPWTHSIEALIDILLSPDTRHKAQTPVKNQISQNDIEQLATICRKADSTAPSRDSTWRGLEQVGQRPQGQGQVVHISQSLTLPQSDFIKELYPVSRPVHWQMSQNPHSDFPKTKGIKAHDYVI